MAGTNFTLDAAKRIAATVRKIEAMSGTTDGPPNPARKVGDSFWAMLTGCELTGSLWDWVAVMPDPSGAIADPNTTNDSSISNRMWTFQEPYVAGWACAEANGNRQIDVGTVVQLIMVGYAIPQVDASSGPAGVTTIEGSASGVAGADGSIPFYTFNYAVQPATFALPIHDHRDNVTGGGFAFAVYHPGTTLPQQPWSV